MTVAAADGASATACSEPLNLAAAGRATEIVTERSNDSLVVAATAAEAAHSYC